MSTVISAVVSEWRPILAFANALDGRQVHLRWGDGNEHDLDLEDLLRRYDPRHMLDEDSRFTAMEVGPDGVDLRWEDGLIKIPASFLSRIALRRDGERFRQWRSRHSLTQSEANEALGLKKRAAQRFESASQPIDRTVWLAMVGYDTLNRHL